MIPIFHQPLLSNIGWAHQPEVTAIILRSRAGCEVSGTDEKMGHPNFTPFATSALHAHAGMFALGFVHQVVQCLQYMHS